MSYTPIDEIPKIREALNAGYATGKLRSIAYRKKQILALGYLLKDNKQRFEAALRVDLGRPRLETNFLEIDAVITEIVHTYHHVEQWVKPEKVAFDLNTFPMRPTIRKESVGTVLIIGPFNFPLFCTLGPLVSAIAAGNACAIKPSELNKATTALIADLIPQYLDSSLYRVIQGAIPETTKVLELQWDHILYTGSGRVGKIVAAAAAKHLTPVTLELGGKNPSVIDPKCDVKLAARRILWGKVANAGQICLTTDYILVPREFQDKLVQALQDEYASFFPEGPRLSLSFSRMATDLHFNRVKTLLDNTKGTVVVGGQTEESNRYIAPTIVRDVTTSDSLMSDEIFGPVLPIVPVNDVDEALSIINSRDRPLAVYVFTQDAKFKAKVADNTHSGGVVANETVIHAGIAGLPFGGNGFSGYGSHTGKFGFDAFTHKRASMDVPGFLDIALKNRYPPYTASKLKFLSSVLAPKLPPRDGKPRGIPKIVLILVLAAVLAGGAKYTEYGRNVLANWTRSWA